MSLNDALQRRVLFYSHDGTGLGHLRITLGVATAYSQCRPNDSLLLLTGSLQAGAFSLPANLDYIKLPAMPKRDLYASLPPPPGFTGSHNSTIRFRSAIALTTVQSFDPHLVVVDHAPGGLFREFAPSLDWLLSRRPRPRLAMLMRDITFGPEQTRSIWQGEQVYHYLNDGYDRILVYGDRRVFDPIAAYGLTDTAVSRIEFCGYLPPQPARRDPADIRGAYSPDGLPLIVVSVGGGADGASIIKAYLRGLTLADTPAVSSYIVLGPLLPEADRLEIHQLARVCPNLHLVEFDPDFPAAVAAADVVVCMGGYNSVTEAVYFRKRPVVIPRLPGPEEQILRAEGFAQLGLATVVDPATLSAESLWAAICAELQAEPPPRDVIPFTGLGMITTELANLEVG